MAIIDSSGNQYTGKCYKPGGTRTVKDYEALAAPVYLAGAEVYQIGKQVTGLAVATGDSNTYKLRGTSHSSGTAYVTSYGGGYAGNGGGGYLRGNTPGTSCYYYNSGASASYTRMSQFGSTLYYGNGSYVTDRGDYVAFDLKNIIEYSGTLYEAGADVSVPKYDSYSGKAYSSGSKVTTIGAEVTNAWRDTGDSTDYTIIGAEVSLKLADATTKDVGALTYFTG